MLYSGIRDAYRSAAERHAQLPGVEMLTPNPVVEKDGSVRPRVFATGAATFRQEPTLQEEVFGPATVVVRCLDLGDLIAAVERLEGQLTATLHATEGELHSSREILDLLVEKAGRILLGGVPTGVEVCAAMHHGGPYPATTDPRFTSVGTAAIHRWQRPVCFQGFPTDPGPGKAPFAP